MGRSEERKDIFGDKYTQHFDNDGRKAGRTEARKDVFGDEYEQHLDESGRKIGRSEMRKDLFGDEYKQHKDGEARDSGRSEQRRDLFGDDYTQHFDEDGRRSGRSERRKDLFGDEYVDHRTEEGNPRGFFKSAFRRQEFSSDPIEMTLQFIWWYLRMSVLVTLGFIVAVIVYRRVRFVCFAVLTFVLQAYVYLSIQQIGAQWWTAVAGGLAAGLAAVAAYRLCFSLLRLGGPQEGRSNAWAISGGMAVASVVAIVVIAASDPLLMSPGRFSVASAPPLSTVIEEPAPAVALAMSSSLVASIVSEGIPQADVREFEVGNPVGYFVQYAGAQNDTIRVTVNANEQVVTDCAPFVMNGSGDFYCQFQSFAEGAYVFRVDINGSVFAELPFVVRAKGDASAVILSDPSLLRDGVDASAAQGLASAVAGNWRGEYWRGDRRPTALEMTIWAEGVRFNGSGSEPRLLGPLYLTLNGSMQADRAVEFAMRTDGGYVVRYNGALSEDGNVITGQWQRGERSGEFRLERSGDK